MKWNCLPVGSCINTNIVISLNCRLFQLERMFAWGAWSFFTAHCIHTHTYTFVQRPNKQIYVPYNRVIPLWPLKFDIYNTKIIIGTRISTQYLHWSKRTKTKIYISLKMLTFSAIYMKLPSYRIIFFTFDCLEAFSFKTIRKWMNGKNYYDVKNINITTACVPTILMSFLLQCSRRFFSVLLMASGQMAVSI